jgi:hypothetical protein
VARGRPPFAASEAVDAALDEIGIEEPDELSLTAPATWLDRRRRRSPPRRVQAGGARAHLLEHDG